MTEKPSKQQLRVLIVEDDPAREARLRGWLPEGFRAVVVPTAGAAIGTLRMDPGSVYSAILLDHDLQNRATIASDLERSGRDVADAIIRHVAREVPVLVHSMNASRAGPMVQLLRRAGFVATQVPMADLDERFLRAWLEAARRRFEGSADDGDET